MCGTVEPVYGVFVNKHGEVAGQGREEAHVETDEKVGPVVKGGQGRVRVRNRTNKTRAKKYDKATHFGKDAMKT